MKHGPNTDGAEFHLEMLPQPDDTTCGPTCLHAVYQYHGDKQDLLKVISEVQNLETGGTLAVMLAHHALRRGYRATLYTYNLHMFDPTWFAYPEVDLKEMLQRQAAIKRDPKLTTATQAYLEYLDLGGEIRFERLGPKLLEKYIRLDLPILTGLSATYLYGCAREYNDDYDAVRGEPSGHFVVLCGYDPATREVTVADPLSDNPRFDEHRYRVGFDRLIGAIFLGIATYDANLLVLEPGTSAEQDVPS